MLEKDFYQVQYVIHAQISKELLILDMNVLLWNAYLMKFCR